MSCPARTVSPTSAARRRIVPGTLQLIRDSTPARAVPDTARTRLPPQRKMTSKERVLLSLDHKPPDWVPLDLTQDEVRAEVRALVDTMGRDGGYILAPSHTLMDDVPLGNVLAMYDEARHHGGP